uniref:Acid phosphatase n=1 Tax=uncultured bacterium esnapd1.2 TaxID=1366589 RepID=S5TLT5_9BACT|nr:hypothetical protein [uncultured bacterium esnapd1.2]
MAITYVSTVADMRTLLRYAVASAAAATACVLAVPAAASAENPAQPAALALPSYETWVADVSAVAATASDYLDARLPDAAARPAIVLDIDNTALQTQYKPGLVAPATESILDVARQASADGAAVFFVTARPEILGWQTEANLRKVGYPFTGIYLRPWFNTLPDAELKTNAREDIERKGYTIVANIGNNASDLAGGHAERTFKLPDYDGQLV